MIFYYLDSSAWVKRYCQEPGTSWVSQRFSEECVLVCSNLGLPEVMATLARKHKAQQLSAADFRTKAAELESDWEHFVRVELNEETCELSKDAAQTWALRGADAVHFAAATLTQSQLSAGDQIILVTADTEMLNAASQSGINFFDPNTV